MSLQYQRRHTSAPPRKVVELCTSIAAIFQNETDVNMDVSQRRNKNLLYLESQKAHLQLSVGESYVFE